MNILRKMQDGGHYDVIVCGAGPAGVGAALCLGRAGMKVLLLEQMGCVGGCWTSGLMSIALDMPDKGGIPKEIMDGLMQQNKAAWADSESYVYSPEAMKHHLESKLVEAHVDLQYFMTLTGAATDEGRIRDIYVDGLASRVYRADWYVDATGHGTLSAYAGCEYEIGYPGSEKQQPASLEALVSGVPDTWESDIHNKSRKRALFEMLAAAGVACSYTAPLLFRVAPGARSWKLAINHQYDVSIDKPETVTQATIAARKEINLAVEALKTLPGWESLTLVATAEQIGIRDNKRISGLYELTGEDCMAGETFSDGVVPARYFLDVHQLSDAGHVNDEISNRQARPYQIPLRSLIPKQIHNLMVAGRCLSGDFFAHSSYRMTNTACATGEAVAEAIRAHFGTMDNTHMNGEAVRRTMLAKGYTL